MVQNAAEGKEDARSVNAERVCSHTELRIIGNINKLVYWTFRITAHSSINSQVHLEFLETSPRPHLYGLGYPRPPSSRVTLAPATFRLFLCKIQPTVYIRISNPGVSGRQDNFGKPGQAGQLFFI